uniref:Uncharacterized protein n=1 Tax=Ciona intestinalis TaxID=7719 RepID=H2XMF3_CIOIN
MLMRLFHFSMASCIDDVINLQDAADRLRSKLYGAGGDQKRLENILLSHVRDSSSSYIDSTSAVTVSMTIT